MAAALDIYLSAGEANDTQVKSPEDFNNYKDRIQLQEYALRRCRDLNRLILLAKPLFHLSTKRVKYWVGLVKEVKSFIKAWSDSDKKRFMPLFEDRDVG